MNSLMMQKDRNLEPLLPEKNKNYKQTNVYYCTFHLMTEHVYLLKSELAKEMWKISSISLQKKSVDILEYIL